MKNIVKHLSFALFLIITFTFCENRLTNENEGERLRTGRVTFFNESSYRVNVRRDAFSGPIVAKIPPNQPPVTVYVRVSDHALGTTFSIEYLYQVTGPDTDSGDIFASGIDINVQINRVVEESRSVTIQIPQPANLEFKTAFIKITNTHNLPAELRRFGTIFSQAGTGNIPIAPGRTGVFRLDQIPPGEGFLLHGFNIVSTFAVTPLPEFTAQNGFIYSFIFDGTSVRKTGERTIIF